MLKNGRSQRELRIRRAASPCHFASNANCLSTGQVLLSRQADHHQVTALIDSHTYLAQLSYELDSSITFSLQRGKLRLGES